MTGLRAPLAALMGCSLAMAAAGQATAPAPCADVAAFSTLDFWLGEWDVLVDGLVAGSNRIEKILDGCAVMEHWTAAGGGEGKSLFYHVPATGEWKQVWVTGRATAPGGVKEKTIVPAPEPGAVRFQGRIDGAEGGSYLDRTTLTPRADGTVRQVIEVSVDEGETWRTVWDSVYRRRGG